VWASGDLDAATALPDLGPAASVPHCLATVREGVAIFDTGVVGDAD
jgi:hypothetical protein